MSSLCKPSEVGIYNDKDKILSTIYKLYILFLPFNKLVFWPFPEFISTYLFYNLSTIFLWIGLVYIIFFKRHLLAPDGIKNFGKLYLFMSIYSFLAATVLFIPVGTLNGQTTFRGIVGNIVFYFVVLCSLYFNYYCLSFVIKFSELKKIFIIQAIILLFVGYVQFGIIKGIGGFVVIYNILCKIFELLPIEGLNRGVVFFGTEPAAASNVIMLTISFLLSCFLFKKLSKKQKAVYLLFIILFIPLFMSSDSSSVMITLFITFITFGVILTGSSKIYKALVISAFSVGAVIAIGYGFDSITNIASDSKMSNESLAYLVIGKLFDTNNLSTVMRSSTIVNDMKIFFSNPFLGVGNGLQGIWYQSNLPEWAFKSYEVQSVLKGSTGIVDGGGAFFPTFISAFGIIGIIVFVFTIRKYIKIYKSNIDNMGATKYLFMFFTVIFVSTAWYVLSVHQNQLVAFMLSLPLVNYKKKVVVNK